MNSTARGRTNTRSIRLPAWFSGSGPESEIVISTRIRLARNLNHFPFPSHASPTDRKKIFNTVLSVLRNGAMLGSFSLANFSGIPHIDQRYLVERRVASPELLGSDGDRGVAFDNDDSIAVMINEEDHLRLQCLISGCNPLASWSVLDRLDDRLGRDLGYAYDRRRGYLTACPTNSGTGLRVSFLAHLPALMLTKSIDAVLQGANQLGIGVRGFFGEHSEVIGSFFQLSNQAAMGASEREFITSAEKTVQEIVACEKRARERLLKEARIELSDKIYRAFGVLAYARTLSVGEFLNCASAIRLGIDTGLFTAVSRTDLNAATFAVMPAHLQKFAKRALKEPELSVLRAERVRGLFRAKKTLPRRHCDTGNNLQAV